MLFGKGYKNLILFPFMKILIKKPHYKYINDKKQKFFKNINILNYKKVSTSLF
jgi:hypothetical protein